MGDPRGARRLRELLRQPRRPRREKSAGCTVQPPVHGERPSSAAPPTYSPPSRAPGAEAVFSCPPPVTIQSCFEVAPRCFFLAPCLSSGPGDFAWRTSLGRFIGRWGRAVDAMQWSRRSGPARCVRGAVDTRLRTLSGSTAHTHTTVVALHTQRDGHQGQPVNALTAVVCVAPRPPEPAHARHQFRS